MKLDPHIAKHIADPSMIASFGLVLYTDEHPNLKKALRDSDYWQALHKSSGQKWVIFSARAVQGSYECPKFPPGTMGMMISTWKEPEENRELLETFELESTKQLPRFVVFTQIKEDRMLKCDIGLSDDSVEGAFNCLSTVINEITNVVEKIDLENRDNKEEIFYLLESAVDGLKFRRGAKKFFDLADVIKKWAS